MPARTMPSVEPISEALSGATVGVACSAGSAPALPTALAMGQLTVAESATTIRSVQRSAIRVRNLQWTCMRLGLAAVYHAVASINSHYLHVLCQFSVV